MGNLWKKKNGIFVKTKELTGYIEKQIQNEIEQNLQSFLRLTFLDTEYVTGPYHKGRIDTLAIDRENLIPVIIEYKKTSTTTVINQGMFYLSWLRDHKGDFLILVQKVLKKIDGKIRFDMARVICIAPSFDIKDKNMALLLNTYHNTDLQLIEFTKYEGDIFQLSPVSLNESSTPAELGDEAIVDIRSQPEKHQKPTATRLKDPNWKYKELFEKLCSFVTTDWSDIEIKETTEYFVVRKLTNIFSILGYDDNMKIDFDLITERDGEIMSQIEKVLVDYEPKELITIRDSFYKKGKNYQIKIVEANQLEKAFEVLQIIYNNL
jgi:hypothetical protein